MNNILFFILILLSAWTIESHASEVNLVYYGMSWHSDKYHYKNPEPTKYNESNETLGIEYIEGLHGLTAGVYNDSYNSDAVYAGALYLPLQGSWWHLGVIYGIAHSPNYADGKVIPWALPYLSVGNKWGVNVMYLPKVFGDGAHTVGVQFKVKIL